MYAYRYASCVYMYMYLYVDEGFTCMYACKCVCVCVWCSYIRYVHAYACTVIRTQCYYTRTSAHARTQEEVAERENGQDDGDDFLLALEQEESEEEEEEEEEACESECRKCTKALTYENSCPR